MAHRQGFKTEEERAYAKKRLISYFESGLYKKQAFRQLKMSDDTFKNHFENDEDIQRALKYVPKRKTRAR